MTAAPITGTDVLVQNEAGICRITLNRPDKLNSFTTAMHAELRLALEAAREDEACRVVLLTGAGRGFCAGQDLSDPAVAPNPAHMPDIGKMMDDWYNPLIRLLRSMPKPIICAVNGTAAGAGANIALACDIVLAAKSASFIQAFAKIGLVPDSGGTWVLPRLIGEARARAICMLGTPVKAEQAEQWGMIWKAVDDAALMTEAEALAAQFATAPTFGLGQTKLALLAAANTDLETQLALERDMQTRCGFSPDYLEGVTAFAEKRKPVYTGRES